jgi:hypothetical protein
MGGIVYCIELNEDHNLLASYCENIKKVQVWDISFLRKAISNSNINQISFKTDIFEVLNIDFKEVMSEWYTEDFPNIECMKFQNNNIFCGDFNGSIYIYNLE